MPFLSSKHVAAALAVGLAGVSACSDSSTSVKATPAALAIVSGNTQQGAVGAQLGVPLTVVVRNASGAPVSGAAVAFQVTEGGGTVVPATATTDATGTAATQLTLGGQPGSVKVTATVQGTALTAAFSAMAFAAASTECTPAPALAVGQATTAIAGTSLCVAGTSTSADYVLVPFYSSTVSSARTNVTFTTSGAAAPTASFTQLSSLSLAADASVGAASLSLSATPEPSRAFERRMREGERRDLTRLMPGARAWRTSRADGALRNAIPKAVAVGDRLQLNANANVPCTQSIMRSGRVVAVTSKAIIVADSVNPAGGFTDAEYQSIGVTFDTLVHPMDTRYFGEPSDIDGNGRVLIFFTKAVNDLTVGSGSYIGGFFYARDLFPTVSTATLDGCQGSNVGEMFYLMVPDPARAGAFTKTNVTKVAIATLAHEYQHLINAARRLYVNVAAEDFEEVWLNEGLSHIAEELLFYETSKLQPRQNLDAATVRRSQTTIDAFNADAIGNFGRYDSYLEQPSDFSPFLDNDSLGTRGATWSYLRYVADHRSTTDGDLWNRLVNSTATGIANLRQVLGADPMALARAWSIAVATDDLAGFDAAYQQPSWNFRDIYSVLRASTVFPLATRTLSSTSPTDVTLAAGSAAYLRFGVAAGGSAQISWTAPSGAVQLALVRTK